MRHLAIRFKSGVICAYPSTTESDYDGLVRSVSAGMWVHKYVYGVSYTLGIPGPIIDRSGVFSQSGWVQEAILYDDARPVRFMDTPQYKSNMLAREFPNLPANPKPLPAPTSYPAPSPVTPPTPTVPPTVEIQIGPVKKVVQVLPVVPGAPPTPARTGPRPPPGAPISAWLNFLGGVAVGRITSAIRRKRKGKGGSLDISAYKPTETKPPKRPKWMDQ